MTGQRTSVAAVAAAFLVCAAPPAAAAPAEPSLVVTPLSDPDPNFVPPPPEPKARHARRNDDDENPTLDQAFENLGRVTGALAQKMGEKYRPSDADLKAAQERLRQRLLEDAGNSQN